MEFKMSKKVGIICAVDLELAPFISHMENVKVTRESMLDLYEGEISGVPVAAVRCGVCKVNAAIAAQTLIRECGADIVINAGTAGGMDKRLSLFDTVISTETVYHDVEAHFLMEYHPRMDSVYFKADSELLRLSEIAVSKAGCADSTFFGRMATGEAFIDDDGRGEINDKYSPLTVDMESAAIAHVCYVNLVPFISIRSITDTADHSGVGTFEENCEKASVIAKDVTVALLREIGAAG